MSPRSGVNWKTGKVMFQAFTETDQVTFDDATFPATARWKDVSRPPTSITSLDPILETDSVTGRTFVSQLAPPCSVAAFTDSDGEPTATNPNGYTPFAGCGVGSNFDHQTVGVGKAAGTLPNAYGGRNVWYCSQVVVESTCSVSRNGGLPSSRAAPCTPSRASAEPPRLGCEGLHGHLNVSPKDGTAYLPNFACNSAAAPGLDRPSVVVSSDEGLSWAIRQVPDGTSPNFDSDPAADVDEDGTAYVAYENATSNMMVAITKDKGATFSPSTDLGAASAASGTPRWRRSSPAVRARRRRLPRDRAEAPLNNQGVPENQLLSFDPDGNDPTAGWHAYIAMTYDGGATWTTTDVTPTDPVQRGCIWWGSAQGSGGAAGGACENNKRNLLDFNDITVDQQGRVLFGFADGCVARCVTEGHTRNTNVTYANRDMARDSALTQAQFDELYSQEDIGTIVRQQSGKGLYAAFDEDPKGPAKRARRAARRRTGCSRRCRAPRPLARTAPARSPLAGAGRPRVGLSRRVGPAVDRGGRGDRLAAGAGPGDGRGGTAASVGHTATPSTPPTSRTSSSRSTTRSSVTGSGRRGRRSRSSGPCAGR